jgi:predicted metalloenzyme YecM
MTSLREFFVASEESVLAFNNWANAHPSTAKADHICYKCGDATEFEHLRSLFEKESAFLYQSIISARRIAIIKFLTPIETSLGPISILELSDQKPDGSQQSGFDHIEIYPTEGSLDDLVATLEQTGTSFEKVTRPHHTTFDAKIFNDFKVRLESEPLLEKIKREEFI